VWAELWRPDAKGRGLLRRERPAELTPEQLQLFVVARAELVDRNLGAPDLGNGGHAETTENVADTPDPEADDQEPDHSRHDDLAEPIGRGFSQTPKHERVRSLSELKRCSLPLPLKAAVGNGCMISPKRRHFWAIIIGSSNGYRNPQMPRQTSAPSCRLPQNRCCLLGRGLLAHGCRGSDGSKREWGNSRATRRVGIRHGGRLHPERPGPAGSR